MTKREIFERVANGELTKAEAKSLLSDNDSSGVEASEEEPAPLEERQDVESDSGAVEGDSGEEPSGSAFEEDPEALAHDYLTPKVADALGVPVSAVDLEMNLLDLGLESTTLVQMAEQIESDLDVELYPTIFFEHQTLAAVIEYFAEAHPDALRAYTTEESQSETSPEPASRVDTHTDEIENTPSEEEPAPLEERQDVESDSGAVEGDSGEEPSGSAVEEDPEALAHDYLTPKVADALGVPVSAVDLEMNLLDLGLESTTLVQMAEQIESDLDVELYPTIFFEHQTLAAVIEYFAEAHPDALRAYTTEESQSETSPEPASRVDTHTDQIEDKPSEDDIATEGLHYYTGTWTEVTLPKETPPTDISVVACASKSALSAVLRELRSDADRADAVIPVWLGRASDVPEGEDEDVLVVESSDPSGWEELLNTVDTLGEPFPITFLGDVSAAPGSSDAVDALNTAVIPLVRGLKSLLDSAVADRVDAIDVALRTQDVFAGAWATALDGFTSSLSIEVGDEVGGFVLAEPKDELLGTIRAEQTHSDNGIALHIGDTRHVRRLSNLQIHDPDGSTNLRERGIYLITGGAGGIGWAFARHLAQTVQARLVLVGRSSEDESIRQKLETLRDLGVEAQYRSCDVSDPEAVNTLVEEVKQQYQFIHGIVHSAGLLRDRALQQKDIDDFREVLRPKVDGAAHLDHATRNEPLDLFVVFSSIAALTGNRGQTDYAFANGFMDGFACTREVLCERGERSGQTLTINWPLWAEGGMQPHDAVVDYMKRELGMETLDTDKGIEAFGAALASGCPQVAVVDGDASRIGPWMGVDSGATATPADILDTWTALVPDGEDTTPDSPTRGDGAVTFPDHTSFSPTSSSGSRGKQSSRRETEDDAIAVVGMHGRFPQSPDLDAFWDNLTEGRDLVGSSDTRIDWGSFLGEKEEEIPSFPGGFIEDVEKFDANFFDVSPREASAMDPQQRLMLESAWSTLEDAGYDPTGLSGSSTGVFVGASTDDFRELLLLRRAQINPEHSIGLAKSVIANRISYMLDLQGPSEVVDTACSSSLVAMNRAVRAMQRGECEQALIGGINIILSPSPFLAFGRTGILSEKSRCRAFDKDANGYVRGEGLGTLFLKPRSKALEDGDHIYAVVKGAAVNHGGHAQSLTAPNPRQQANVIGRALNDANVDPASIGYVEAHGTGTSLGDPVEVEGLKRAFRRAAEEPLSGDEKTCGLASVKSNIGHLEAAAGIAGMVKVILCLQHSTLPKSLHIDEVNPYVDIEDSPFYLVRETTSWPRPTDSEGTPLPRHAGVSSFGFGGTNAHVVFEEAPAVESGDEASEVPQSERDLFLFSAKTQDRLDALLGSMVTYLDNVQSGGIDVSFHDIAYTLQVGRPTHSEKIAIVANDKAHLQAVLEDVRAGEANTAVIEGETRERSHLSQIFEDNVGKAFLSDLYAQDKLESLGALWVEGVDIDWDELRRDEKRSRVSLPTYPFARESHWIENVPPGEPLVQDCIARSGAESFESPPSKGEDGVSTEIEGGESRSQSAKCEEVDRSSAGGGASLNESPDTSSPSDVPTSQRGIETFLRKEVAKTLGHDPSDLDRTVPLDEYGMSSINGMALVKSIKERYDFPVYAGEIAEYSTIEDLACYLHDELQAAPETSSTMSSSDVKEEGSGTDVVDGAHTDADSSVDPPESGPDLSAEEISSNGNTAVPAAKDTDAATGIVSQTSQEKTDTPIEEPITFLLSTPRAGSTLLRTMLMGHSGLFAPPELHLLGFETLEERAKVLNETGLDEGLTECIRVLDALSADEAVARVERFEDDARPVSDAYRYLQERVHPQRLVDKSPTYAWDSDTLERAERMFVNANYVFLVRHPLAVMESIIRNRFHRLLGDRVDASTPTGIAEAIWFQMNGTIRDFLDGVPSERCHTVRYENLVVAPERTMRRLSDVLGVEFESEMVQPYADDRLTSGLHDTSMTVGDPNFDAHTSIDSTLAYRWTGSDVVDVSLDDSTIDMASQFGYDLGTAYPITSNQSSYVPDARSGASGASTCHLVHRVTLPTVSRLEVARLRDAAESVMRMHPVLKTCLDADDNRLLGTPVPADRLAVESLDLSDVDDCEAARDDAVDALVDRVDVENGPTVGVLALNHGDTVSEDAAPDSSAELVLVYPHLLGDGYASMQILRTLLDRYHDRSYDVPRLEATYQRFVDMQADLAGRADAVDTHPWMHVDADTAPPLPIDRDTGSNVAAVEAQEQIDATGVLDAYRDHDHTPSLFDIFGVSLIQLLSAWQGTPAPIVALRYHGRLLDGVSFADTVGCFAHDVPLRVDTRADDVLAALQDAVYDATYAEIPYPILRDAGRVEPVSTLTDVRFNFQRFADPLGNEAKVSMDASQEVRASQYPRSYRLDLITRVADERIVLLARYSENHFEPVTIRQRLMTWAKKAREVLLGNHDALT